MFRLKSSASGWTTAAGSRSSSWPRTAGRRSQVSALHGWTTSTWASGTTRYSWGSAAWRHKRCLRSDGFASGSGLAIPSFPPQHQLWPSRVRVNLGSKHVRRVHHQDWQQERRGRARTPLGRTTGEKDEPGEVGPHRSGDRQRAKSLDDGAEHGYRRVYDPLQGGRSLFVQAVRASEASTACASAVCTA